MQYNRLALAAAFAAFIGATGCSHFGQRNLICPDGSVIPQRVALENRTGDTAVVENEPAPGVCGNYGYFGAGYPRAAGQHGPFNVIVQKPVDFEVPRVIQPGKGQRQEAINALGARRVQRLECTVYGVGCDDKKGGK